ncbi:MAG: hypothetical protein A2Z29_05665 [Chloroflexi bacterium RBG_16_56_11]|nr:MAG: hypothetical protein A2Z29_05665 [Chloroflexi bacterium RBG_16_56_11]
MKKRFMFTLVAALIIFPVLLSGCQSAPSGISQSQYDQVMAQLAEAQTQLDAAQKNAGDLMSDKAAADAQLKTSQAEVARLAGQAAQLQTQLAALSEQYDFTGATPAETAAKIVKYYHETHIYSAYDLFVCSDMAAEVWNMLKAQGISAIVAVGDIDTPITDIILSDHAWVLAEVAPGQYLALETTGGRVVLKNENGLYYRGWSFDSPAELKDYNRKIWEYNIRVTLRNQLAEEANKAGDLHNNSSNQSEADTYLVLYNKLIALKVDQETALNQLMNGITRLAAVIQ